MGLVQRAPASIGFQSRQTHRCSSYSIRRQLVAKLLGRCSREAPNISLSPARREGWRKAGNGGSGSGGSFLVLIIARPRQARAGAVASAHCGIRFGFESRCGMIGLHCGLSRASEQPHFKPKVFAESKLILNSPNRYRRWVALK